jgi:hypothetical protein
MPTAFVNIVDGKVADSSRNTLKNAIAALPTGKYQFKIERKDQRSLQQNAYLHGVMLPIVRDALYDAGWNNIKTIDHAKEEIIKMFCGYDETNVKTGETKTFYRRTHELTKLQFMELVQDVQIWLLDFFNIELPLPGEQAQLDFTNDKAA